MKPVPLDSSLLLHPPTSPECAPSMLQMQRDRDVELPWLDVLDESHQKLVRVLSPNEVEKDYFSQQFEKNNFKEYFERSWVDAKGFDAVLYTDGEKAVPVAVELAQSLSSDHKKEFSDDFMMAQLSGHYYDQMESGHDAKVKSFDSKICVKDLRSGRVYLLLNMVLEPIEYENTDDSQNNAYHEVWNKVYTLVQVMQPNESDAENPYDLDNFKAQLPRMEVVGALPHHIVQEHDRLEAIKVFAKEVGKHTGAIFTEQKVSQWWNDDALFQKDKMRYAELKSLAENCKTLEQDLAQRASEHGMFLCIEDKTIRLPLNAKIDGVPIETLNKKMGGKLWEKQAENWVQTLKAGELYQVSEGEARWTVTITRMRTVIKRGRSGRASVRRRRYIEYQPRSKTLLVYRPVRLGNNPIEDKIHTLRMLGKKVFVTDATENGYITDSGESLSEVMQACEVNDEFRKNAVVVFRDYEELVTSKPLMLSARFYYNPLPAMFVTDFPQLAIREELSYTLQWNGCELGQLLESIPLSPGEERTVSVSTKATTEKNRAVNTVSSLMTTSEESSDFTSEFHNEVSKEYSKVKTKTMSASAGGSFGGFSAKASGGSKTTTSLKNFSKTMQKVARKAARKVSSNTQLETSVETKESSYREDSKSASYKVKNVNVGATLNIMLYQINNRYSGGLYLDDLKLVVTRGRELILGTGIFEEKVFDLNKLGDVIQEFSPSQLPVKLGEKFNQNDYWKVLLTRLVDVLSLEYEHLDKSNKETAESALILDKYTFSQQPSSNQGQSFMDWLNKKNEQTDSVEELYYAVEEVLETAKISMVPLVSDSLIVASNGVYADSLLGIGKATEQYSEDMRAAELLKAKAEAASVVIKNNYKLSMAKNVQLNGNGSFKVENVDGNIITISVNEDIQDVELMRVKLGGVELNSTIKREGKSNRYKVKVEQNDNLELSILADYSSALYLVDNNGKIISTEN